MIEITEEQQAAIDRMLELKLKRLRARRLLEDAPDMVAHVLAQVPRAGGVPGPHVSGGEKAPLPLNARALEDANSLYSQLANWAINHARALHVMPPASVLGWWRLDENCDGFPSWATRGDSAALLRAVTDWLVAADARIAGLSMAEEFWDDVREIMGPLYARYPRTVPRPRFASRSCPLCDRKTIIVDFDDRDTLGYPEDLGYSLAVVTVACTYCGHVIPTAGIEKYLEEKPR